MVVITTGTVEMMAGVAANGRGIQVGPRGEALVLPPAVEMVSWLRVFVLGHLALVLLRDYPVICAHVSLFCSLNSALMVVRFFMPCVSIDGGVEKCTAVLFELRGPSDC